MMGRISKPAAISEIRGGQLMAKCAIAVTNVWQDKKTKMFKKKTVFFNLTFWDQYLIRKLEKVMPGNEIWVEGDLEPNTFAVANGTRRHVINFYVTNMMIPRYYKKPTDVEIKESELIDEDERVFEAMFTAHNEEEMENEAGPKKVKELKNEEELQNLSRGDIDDLFNNLHV